LWRSSERPRAAAAWAEELADAKENAEPGADGLGSDSEEIVVGEGRGDGPIVIVKRVSCGKDNCSSCPYDPYQYHITRDGDSVSWEYRGTAEVGQS
jgi:hypothetical protein